MTTASTECWEYPAASSVTVYASYQLRSSAGHYEGEVHEWWMQGIDMAGGDVGEIVVLLTAQRNPDTTYPDELSFQIPAGAEGARVYNMSDEILWPGQLGNIWITVHTLLSTPTAASASLNGTTATVTWTNGSMFENSAYTTQLERRVNGGSWTLRATVPSDAASSFADINLTPGTYEYQLRHRHQTNIDQDPSPTVTLYVVRLSDYQSAGSVIVPPPPSPLSVAITFGPSSVKPTFPDCRWRATAQGGQPPYQYTWKLNGKWVVGTKGVLTMTTPTSNFTLNVIASYGKKPVQSDTATLVVSVSSGAPPCP